MSVGNGLRRKRELERRGEVYAPSLVTKRTAKQIAARVLKQTAERRPIIIAGNPCPGGFINDLERAYPRANLPDAWWLGNGMVEVVSHRGRIRLLGFWVAPNRRQQGHGAAMLDILCGLADRHRVTIDTWADRYDKKHEGLYNGQLRAWYARWGFLPHPTKPGWLQRVPR